MKKSFLALLVIIAACAVGASAQTKKRAVRKRPPVKTAVKKPTVAALSNQAAVTTASGLTIVVTKKGDGLPVRAGQTVTVNYTGMLTDGTRFDSSLERGEPFAFPVGAGRVIKGWDEGLQRLKVGDHAILVIPSELAYGSRGAGRVGGGSRGVTTLIPPDATLVFLIEVIGVE